MYLRLKLKENTLPFKSMDFLNVFKRNVLFLPRLHLFDHHLSIIVIIIELFKYADLECMKLIIINVKK